VTARGRISSEARFNDIMRYRTHHSACRVLHPPSAPRACATGSGLQPTMRSLAWAMMFSRFRELAHTGFPVNEFRKRFEKRRVSFDGSGNA
jgi:hypothetical protein